VQTLGCGIERISNIDKHAPSAKLVDTFPGSFCGVPTIVGHYLIQIVPLVHGVQAKIYCAKGPRRFADSRHSSLTATRSFAHNVWSP
jgi:hypothetical protein